MIRILAIDDESTQVDSIKKAIGRDRPDIFVDTASLEDEIRRKVSETYYTIAVVDLRMDNMSMSGFDIIREITELNPFAKIIISSAYVGEYSDDLNVAIKTGKIVAILNKEKFDIYISNLISAIDRVAKEHEEDTSLSRRTLEYFFSDAKNTEDSFSKGKKFEYFVVTLFAQMGFNHINLRVKDRSSNEVDLLIRNELKDNYFQKFSPYFLVECKNTVSKVDKNMFIQFNSKLKNTNGLADLGFIITSSGFKRTTYMEAMRTSGEDHKIVFISNAEISELISSDSLTEGLKKIMDSQVKDN